MPSGTYAVSVTEGSLIIVIRHCMGFSLSRPARTGADHGRIEEGSAPLCDLPNTSVVDAERVSQGVTWAAMAERESMRPLRRNALLTIICAMMICALAAAVAGFALTGRASPARQSVTCCTAARPTVQHRTGVTWISRGVQEPKLQWQRAGTTFGATSGALRQISVPFLRLLSGGVVGSLPNARGPIPEIVRHIAWNWWEEGGLCVILASHRYQLARHRRPPPHQRENPPRTPPRKHSKTEKKRASTRPGAPAEVH